MFEFLVFAILWLIALTVPLAVLILSVVTFFRTRRIAPLEKRIYQLEVLLQQQQPGAGADSSFSHEERQELPAAAESEIAITESRDQAPPEAVRRPIQWEYLIGQKAFGWAAVALAVFATSFFLKYTYENNWVGPIGRVSIGVLIGATMMVAGRRQYGLGWRLLSQMLSACGIIVLYLSAYSAFGFYHLLPSFHAGVFLAGIAILSAICAVRYNSLIIALVAVVGGLACPLLMQTGHDSYMALFSYLAALNLGVAVISLARGWPGLGTLALLGTHIQFWMWYGQYYHPEKIGWALGFQIFIYAIYLAQDLAAQFRDRSRYPTETAGRILANAALWFTAFYVLMQYDYSQWMGVAAIAMAAGYALTARLLLNARANCTMELVTLISISAGFIAVAIPLEADARWIAFAWAVTATCLWWFSLRVEMPPLRFISLAIIGVAALRLLSVDLWSYPDTVHLPLLNTVALPSTGVTLCMLTAAIVAGRYGSQLRGFERVLVRLLGFSATVLLWVTLTVDVYHFFEMLGRHAIGELAQMQWLGEMFVSVFWTVFASILLTLGFRFRRAAVRWMAICVFVITILKVFIVDMSELDEIYRIIAFFVLAISLAVAARVYQRMRLHRDAETSQEVIDNVP